MSCFRWSNGWNRQITPGLQVTFFQPAVSNLLHSGSTAPNLHISQNSDARRRNCIKYCTFSTRTNKEGSHRCWICWCSFPNWIEEKAGPSLLLDDRSDSEAVLQRSKYNLTGLFTCQTLVLKKRKRALTQIRDHQQPYEERFIHCGK